MIPVSIVSLKTMKNTGTAKTLTVMMIVVREALRDPAMQRLYL